MVAKAGGRHGGESSRDCWRDSWRSDDQGGELTEMEGSEGMERRKKRVLMRCRKQRIEGKWREALIERVDDVEIMTDTRDIAAG
jgi:hypothetical protein